MCPLFCSAAAAEQIQSVLEGHFIHLVERARERGKQGTIALARETRIKTKTRLVPLPAAPIPIGRQFPTLSVWRTKWNVNDVIRNSSVCYSRAARHKFHIPLIYCLQSACQNVVLNWEAKAGSRFILDMLFSPSLSLSLSLSL